MINSADSMMKGRRCEETFSRPFFSAVMGGPKQLPDVYRIPRSNEVGKDHNCNEDTRDEPNESTLHDHPVQAVDSSHSLRRKKLPSVGLAKGVIDKLLAIGVSSNVPKQLCRRSPFMNNGGYLISHRENHQTAKSSSKTVNRFKNIMAHNLVIATPRPFFHHNITVPKLVNAWRQLTAQFTGSPAESSAALGAAITLLLSNPSWRLGDLPTTAANRFQASIDIDQVSLSIYSCRR